MPSLLLGTSYPQLVQGLHTSFLGYLRTEIGGSSHLPATHGQQLLERIDANDFERHVRRTADELMFALNEGWVDSKRKAHGNDSVDLQRYHGSRLFEPLEGALTPLYSPRDGERDLRANTEKLFAEVDRYDPAANVVLEITCRRSIFDIISLYMIHEDLRLLGMCIYSLMDVDKVTVRIPTFTLLEAGLRHCLGKDALKPCYVPGEIASDKVNELHKTGYHPVGMPLRPSSMHGRIAKPVEWPWHDWHHLIHASIHMPFWVQRTASLFFELVTKRKDSVFTGVAASMEDIKRLQDLDLRRYEDNHIVDVIRRILHNIAGAHGMEAAQELHAEFMRKIDRFFRGEKTGKIVLTEDNNFQNLRRSLLEMTY